jgi:hypothetical protein
MRRNLAFVFSALALLLPTLALTAEDKDGKLIQAPAVHIWDGDEVAVNYRCGVDVAKPYFWPLMAPRGLPLTRAWPMEKATPGGSTDHPHQKSAWFCHGDVIPEWIELKEHVKGIQGVDFWSEAKGHGRIVCKGIRGLVGGLDVKGGGKEVVLTSPNEWLTADGVKILDESRAIHFYVIEGVRLLVLDIDLHASVCPITFGDTKEGSFGVRVNDAIREEKGNGKITNADGKTGEKECWGRISAWCDYSGTIDGKTAGIAIFADPKNPYPSCWHVRGYGLMAANPFGRDKSGFPAMKGKTDLVKLSKGEHLKLRYGLLLHRGDVKEGKVAEHYEQFVKPK